MDNHDGAALPTPHKHSGANPQVTETRHVNRM
jgi:hypothetical protein